MSAYAEKRERRIDSMRAEAETLRGNAAAAFDALHKQGDVMMGTPVLIGHHSQRRHERDLARMDAKMGKAVAATREAATLERRADAAESNRAVSSDDPDAVELLREKLAKVESDRARMVAANKAVRGKFPEQALIAMGFSAVTAEQVSKPDFCGNRGFAPFTLKNAAAEAKRLTKRIEELGAKATAPVRADVAFDGGRIAESREINRVQIFFDAKPSEAVLAALKAAGFRWAPSEEAWQRQASEGAWRAALSAVGGAL